MISHTTSRESSSAAEIFCSSLALGIHAAAQPLAVLLAIPGDYGAGRVFTCIEPFLTPRMAAEALVLFGLAAMAVTACNGITQVSATPGTYVIQVTGTGNNSDIVHYQNVTVTITQ